MNIYIKFMFGFLMTAVISTAVSAVSLQETKQWIKKHKVACIATATGGVLGTLASLVAAVIIYDKFFNEFPEDMVGSLWGPGSIQLWEEMGIIGRLRHRLFGR